MCGIFWKFLAHFRRSSHNITLYNFFVTIDHVNTTLFSCITSSTTRICYRKFIIIILQRIIKYDYNAGNKYILHLSTTCINLSYSCRAISPKGCILWNKLPEDFKILLGAAK